MKKTCLLIISAMLIIGVPLVYYLETRTEKYLADYYKIKYCACRPKKPQTLPPYPTP